MDFSEEISFGHHEVLEAVLTDRLVLDSLLLPGGSWLQLCSRSDFDYGWSDRG